VETGALGSLQTPTLIRTNRYTAQSISFGNCFRMRTQRPEARYAKFQTDLRPIVVAGEFFGRRNCREAVADLADPVILPKEPQSAYRQYFSGGQLILMGCGWLGKLVTGKGKPN